jgi:RNA polymerase sigma factor (sigma-70 family)
MTRTRTNEKPTKPGRPAAFDARVLAYLPGLSRQAVKLGYRGEEGKDLVTDTIILALHRWGSFREDGGMWNWLVFTMRSLSRDRRRQAKATILIADDPDGKMAARVSAAPAQEDYASLCGVLNKLAGRERDMVLRRAAGEMLEEIANDHGISKQRVQQLIDRARDRLKEAA